LPQQVGHERRRPVVGVDDVEGGAGVGAVADDLGDGPAEDAEAMVVVGVVGTPLAVDAGPLEEAAGGLGVSPSMAGGLGVAPSMAGGVGVSPSMAEGLGVSPSMAEGLGGSPRIPGSLGVSPSMAGGLGVSPSMARGLGVSPSMASVEDQEVDPRSQASVEGG